MEITRDLAEVTGALIGDGCLSKFWSRYDNCFRYEVVFTGSGDELPYYETFVQPVIYKAFGSSSKPFLRPDDGSSRFHIRKRNVFDFFCWLKIPVGKKSRTAQIPKVIFNNGLFLKACLRGLWDTDGSIYRVYSKQYKNHSRCYDKQLAMQYKTSSERLAKQVKEALELFSIQTNKIGRTGDCFVIRITS